MKAKGLLIGVNAVLAAACLAAFPARAQTAVDLALPPEPLAISLTELGAAAHVNIVFTPGTVAGKQAPALKGRFSVPAALDRLLKDSGLNVSATSGGSYIVSAARPVEVPPPADVTSVIAPVSEPLAASVVVTGFRLPPEKTLELKHSFNGRFDGIVGQDIARLPVNNAAEAVQHVSGVAISQDQGEGRAITVRGLGPEFTRVEINGIEAQASTDGSTFGANRGRGFDFNVFPSALFNRIDVRKTSSADQIEGSLGATVSLLTPRPFDRRGLRIAAAAQVGYNDMSGKLGQRGNLLVSNTFDNGRLGLLMLVSYARLPFETQNANSGGWTQGSANGGFCKPTSGTGGPCDVPAADLTESLIAYDRASQTSTYAPQFYRYTNLMGELTRAGLIGSAQWRPSQRTQVTADLVVSRFHTRRRDYFLEAIGFGRGASQGGKPEIVPRRVEVDANGAMTYGLFDNVDVRAEQGIDDFTTTFSQVSLELKHAFTDRLRVEVQLGSSLSRFDNFLELSAQIDRFNVDGYSFDIRGDATRPSINYNFNVTDPANWYFGPRLTQAGGTGAAGPDIRFRPNYTRNGFDTVRTKLAYDLSGGYQLSAGLESKRYTFKAIAYRLDQGEGDFPAPAAGLADLTRPFCGENAIDPPPGTPRCWRVPDLDAFVRTYDLFSNQGRTALTTTNAAARGLNQSVTENDLSVFVQLNFRHVLFGLPLRGDIGLRNVRTGQTSVFYTNVPVGIDPSGFQLTRAHHRYSEALPSLNLALDINPRTVLRFSAAKVMARPPLAAIAASTRVVVNGIWRQVITGNPNLEPFRADSYDLAWEWYPTKNSIVSLGLFYKDVTTYIQNLTHIAPYASTGLPASLLDHTGVSVNDDFSISSIVNAPGGPVRGLEFSFDQPLKFLPGRWSGLGVAASYTLASSNINYQTTTATGTSTINADLLNLSRQAYTAAVYYNRGPWQARLSTSYRDRYLTSVPGAFGADAGGVDPAPRWDASIGYKVNTRLILSVEAMNMTNAPSETWDHRAAHLMGDHSLSGRQFYLGLRYSY
jgi:TonB-dependent receptor